MFVRDWGGTEGDATPHFTHLFPRSELGTRGLRVRGPVLFYTRVDRLAEGKTDRERVGRGERTGVGGDVSRNSRLSTHLREDNSSHSFPTMPKIRDGGNWVPSPLSD